MPNKKIKEFIEQVDTATAAKPNAKKISVGRAQAIEAAESLRQVTAARAKGGVAAARARKLLDTPEAIKERERKRQQRANKNGNSTASQTERKQP